MRINPGTTSYTGLRVRLVDDSGLPLTGRVAATFPPVYYSVGNNGAAVPISLGDLSAITSAYVSGGVKEDSGAAGTYRLDVPDLVFATADVTVFIYGDATGKHLLCPPIEVGYAKADVVRQLGSDLSNGFAEKDDDGTLHVNVTAVNSDEAPIAALLALAKVFPGYAIVNPDNNTFHVTASSTANLSKWNGYAIVWMPGSANALTTSVISGAAYNGPGLPNDWTITLSAGPANLPVAGDQILVCDFALANIIVGGWGANPTGATNLKGALFNSTNSLAVDATGRVTLGTYGANMGGATNVRTSLFNGTNALTVNASNQASANLITINGTATGVAGLTNGANLANLDAAVSISATNTAAMLLMTLGTGSNRMFTGISLTNVASTNVNLNLGQTVGGTTTTGTALASATNTASGSSTGTQVETITSRTEVIR